MRLQTISRATVSLLMVTLGVGTTVLAVKHRQVGVQSDDTILVPTGQTLTPAGTHIEVRDRPLGMVLSPDGTRLAVVTGSNFNSKALHIIDVESRTLTQTIAISNSFVGVAFNPAGDRIYVGGGGSNDIKIFKATNGVFAADGTIPVSGGPQPSGLALSADGSRLYVALNQTQEIGVIDPVARTIVARVKAGIYPYTVVLSADGRKAYVSNWGGKVPGAGDVTDGQNPVVVNPRTGIPSTGTVSVLDIATNTIARHINVGLHPTGMAMSPAGDRLYVTNANSDTVSVIDTASDAVIKTIQVGHTGPDQKPLLGSSPNAIAVSADGHTLFVANGAENAVAMVDAEAGENDAVLGRIPTGWYPTSVGLDRSGTQVFIASGYGFGSIAPTVPPGEGRSYADRAGVISIVNVPDRGELARLTQQVRRNNASLPPNADGNDDNQGGDLGNGAAAIPRSVGQQSPIKHVFYIIKENRTYDQVFGDMPQGNGDPSLVEFGRNVSPNHHALAEQFALMDNYYGPGDQSALGHRWALQSYPSDWVHKYSNGRNNQNPMLLGPTDAIYDKAKAAGVSVRAYGERGANTITPSNATWTDIYNDWKFGTHNVNIAAQAVIVGLRDVYHPTYPAAEIRVPDQYRADIFLKDLAAYEKNGNLPSLVILLLYDDHTDGTNPGSPTPRAAVADNDLALGRIVDGISHSRYWKESAIFVTEDDSQDGLDHVDGHRTVGLVVSPYVKRGRVDSSFYSIINMFRTMEQILGLSPQNQYDSAAEPMYSLFTSKPDLTPYTARPNQIPLDEMNPQLAGLTGLQLQLAKFSLTIDPSEPDSADADLLNRAIWHSVKGFDVPYNYGRPIVQRHPSFESLIRPPASH